MCNRFSLFLVTALLGLSSSVFAHHAMEVHYLISDSDIVTHQAVVKNFSLMDPHSYLVVSVEENGEVEDWILEGQSRVILTRSGWRFDLLTVGTEIQFTAFPARSGDNAGRIIYIEVGGEIYCSDRCDIYNIETPEISRDSNDTQAQSFNRQIAESF